jgi:Mrp family chromosome partitioning ATPase
MRRVPLVQAAMEMLHGDAVPHSGDTREAYAAPENSEGYAIGQAVSPPDVGQLRGFAALAANLWARHDESALKTLVFVGVGNPSSVSRIASGFAGSLAHSDDAPILLIDVQAGASGAWSAAPGGIADLETTLSRVLSQKAAPRAPVNGGPNLYVLPTADRPTRLSGLYRSAAFDAFLRTVRAQFRTTVIATSDPTSHPECLLLCRKVDGVVLVLESERTRKDGARWAARQIEESGGRLLGTVLNGRRYRLPGWIYNKV